MVASVYNPSSLEDYKSLSSQIQALPGLEKEFLFLNKEMKKSLSIIVEMS